MDLLEVEHAQMGLEDRKCIWAGKVILDERDLNVLASHYVLACTAPARISMFLAVDIGFPITNLEPIDLHAW